jgi:hypothetical protein
VSDDLAVACRATADGFECVVTVGTDAAATRHQVAVSRATLARLAPADEQPERLVEASFRFLLEREPRESILQRFDLPVIARYFPGYEADVRRRLEGHDRPG